MRLKATVLCGMIFFALPAMAQEAPGAKSIFSNNNVNFQPAAKPKPKPSQGSGTSTDVKSEPSRQEQFLGIKYWIDLTEPSGNSFRTTASHVFRSGDRIALNVESNSQGHLYVLSLAEDGSARVLFPNKNDAITQIEARRPYKVPFNQKIKVVDPPGEETLVVMLAPRSIARFKAGQVLVPAQDTRTMVAYAQTQTKPADGSKPLVLDEEEMAGSGAEPANYRVLPVSALAEDGALTTIVRLQHR